MKSSSTRSSATQKSIREIHDEGGFSLLEVIVALTIMAIGFMTVLQLFSGSVKSIGISDQYLKAATLANSKLGELELMDFATNEVSGVFENEENFSWEIETRPYSSQANEAGGNVNLSEFILRVLWKDGQLDRQLELTTLQISGTTTPLKDTLLAKVFSASDSISLEEEEEASEEGSEETTEDSSDSQHLSGSSSGSSSISGNSTQHFCGN
jgi:general secretion pathway protein I